MILLRRKGITFLRIMQSFPEKSYIFALKIRKKDDY